MRRTASILATILIVGLIGAPAFAQPSPVDEVLGESEERPLPGAPEAESPSVGRAGPTAAVASGQGSAGLPRTGLELTTGAALAGALLVGGGLVLLLTRKRPVGSG